MKGFIRVTWIAIVVMIALMIGWVIGLITTVQGLIGYGIAIVVVIIAIYVMSRSGI